MASAGKTGKTVAPKALIYLYGLSQKRAEVKIAGVDAVHPVRAIAAGGLVAWVSDVDNREYGSDLQQNLENLEWVAAAGVQHQRVVSLIHSRLNVLPARFGTVFVSEESLADDVASKKKELLVRLSALEDALEWGVKVFRRAQPRSAIRAASGADYLKKKAQAMQAKDEPDASLQEFARQLGAKSREAARGGKVSSGQRDLIWQGSFLVANDQKKKWDAVLKKFAEQWGETREIECTGPWPPYSFVS